MASCTIRSIHCCADTTASSPSLIELKRKNTRQLQSNLSLPLSLPTPPPSPPIFFHFFFIRLNKNTCVQSEAEQKDQLVDLIFFWKHTNPFQKSKAGAFTCSCWLICVSGNWEDAGLGGSFFKRGAKGGRSSAAKWKPRKQSQRANLA